MTEMCSWAKREGRVTGSWLKQLGGEKKREGEDKKTRESNGDTLEAEAIWGSFYLLNHPVAPLCWAGNCCRALQVRSDMMAFTSSILTLHRWCLVRLVRCPPLALHSSSQSSFVCLHRLWLRLGTMLEHFCFPTQSPKTPSSFSFLP